MKKVIFSIIIIGGLTGAAIFFNVFDSNLIMLSFGPGEEQTCVERSFSQISDSLTCAWDSAFTASEINDNPFAQLIYFIDMFSQYNDKEVVRCIPLQEILLTGRSNKISNALAISAIMQKRGWDILCFFNEHECYLGIYLPDYWRIRKANWVEKDDKKYYLKELDIQTPIGELKVDNPASIYRSIKSLRINLKPIPFVTTLPQYNDGVYYRTLQWTYKAEDYILKVAIPKEQVDLTRNLPPSLYGMVSSGMAELVNISLVNKLKLALLDLNEYDKVNCLFKFCQSESIFTYDSKEQIRSVSAQLLSGKNDCDGRSVFLYCLLRTIVEYPDSHIVFLSWPKHIALGLQPLTQEALLTLQENNGFSVDDKYYILDPAYTGETMWGSKMERLTRGCEIIKQ